MTVLTQTEAEDLAAAYEWAKSTGDPEPFNAVLDAAVERIVAARVAGGLHQTRFRKTPGQDVVELDGSHQ